MSEKKQNWQTPLVVLLVVLAVTGIIRHFHIKNFHTIVPGVLYTSGQPRGMDYTRLLYKYHIATFVNLRQSAEHREDLWYNEEVTWMRENGVNYVELPISKRPDYFPDEATQRKFLKIMSNEGQLPVLLHGSSGKKRVSMLAAVWLVKSKGYTSLKAVEAVEKIKEEPLIKEEKEFIENLAK